MLDCTGSYFSRQGGCGRIPPILVIVIVVVVFRCDEDASCRPPPPLAASFTACCPCDDIAAAVFTASSFSLHPLSLCHPTPALVAASTKISPPQSRPEGTAALPCRAPSHWRLGRFHPSMSSSSVAMTTPHVSPLSSPQPPPRSRMKSSTLADAVPPPSPTLSPQPPPQRRMTTPHPRALTHDPPNKMLIATSLFKPDAAHHPDIAAARPLPLFRPAIVQTSRPRQLGNTPTTATTLPSSLSSLSSLSSPTLRQCLGKTAAAAVTAALSPSCCQF